MSADSFFTAWLNYTLAMAYAFTAGMKLSGLTESAIQSTTKGKVNTHYNSAAPLTSDRRTQPPGPTWLPTSWRRAEPFRTADRAAPSSIRLVSSDDETNRHCNERPRR